MIFSTCRKKIYSFDVKKKLASLLALFRVRFVFVSVIALDSSPLRSSQLANLTIITLILNLRNEINVLAGHGVYTEYAINLLRSSIAFSGEVADDLGYFC